MKQVTLLTDVYGDMTAYSLIIIMKAQMRMLLNAGYSPVVVVDENFTKPTGIWTEVELRHIPTPKERKNHIEFYDGLDDDIVKTHRALETVLVDADVIITHDLIYQCAMLPLNFAARWWAKDNPAPVWLNWVHSATASPVWTTKNAKLEPLQRHFPNSKTVFPNSWDVPRVAASYKCGHDDVAVVPHPTDPCVYFGFQDITRRLVQERDLLSADAILVYPVRLDRGKQVQYVLRVAKGLKDLKKSVRVIVVDFHSTGGDKVTYRDELKALALDLKFNEVEVTFTSEFDQELHLEAPREVVADLMQLCNVFVMPSVSETYSLIAQEAGLCGAFLVLNRDFPPMRSIYGPHAAYYGFSSAVDALTGQDGQTTTKYDDIDGFFRAIAGRVAYELEYNPVLAQRTRIRKERNPDYVFRKFIEPLFFCNDGK